MKVFPLLWFIHLYLIFAACEEDVMAKTLNALHKASRFYEEHFDQVNLDSLFGLRAAEGNEF